MVKEAESHASEDRARREVIDARNQADSLAYQVEKTIHDNRERVPVADLPRIEAAIAEARKAAAGDDLAAITQAVDVLQRASHTLAEQSATRARRAPGAAKARQSRT